MGGSQSKRGDEFKYTKPTGLYASCEWDDKVVKKLIVKKKIAPRYPGVESGTGETEECPICFLNYPGGLNRAKCCKKPICTECFLQLKKPRTNKPVQCPFCNSPNYSVRWLGALTAEERRRVESEEQQVIEAQLRVRREEEVKAVEREKEVAEERAQRTASTPQRSADDSSLASTPISRSDTRRSLPGNFGSPVATGSPYPTSGGSNSRSRSRDPSVDVVFGAQRQMQQQAQQHLHHHFHHHIGSPSAASPAATDVPEIDVEELMIMEAIRRSLAETPSSTPGSSRSNRTPEEIQRRKERRERRARREEEAAAASGSRVAPDSRSMPSTPQPLPPNQTQMRQPSEAELNDDELALALAIRLSLLGDTSAENLIAATAVAAAAAEDNMHLPSTIFELENSPDPSGHAGDTRENLLQHQMEQGIQNLEAVFGLGDDSHSSPPPPPPPEEEEGEVEAVAGDDGMPVNMDDIDIGNLALALENDMARLEQTEDVEMDFEERDELDQFSQLVLRSGHANGGAETDGGATEHNLFDDTGDFRLFEQSAHTAPLSTDL